MQLLRKINKESFFILVAFLLPLIFYWGVFFGRSFGLDCAWGVMGFPPGYKQIPLNNDVYCLNIADIGAYAWGHLPQWIKVANSYLNHSWPLWNQNNGIGVPLAANFISTAYFIPNILFAIPNSVFSFDIYFILRMSIVSLGMYLFLRSFKIPRPVCLIGSLIVFLNGYVTYIPTISHLNVDILLPWIALLINKSFTTKKIKYFVLLSLVTAFSHLGGMPESSVFIALFFIVYTSFLSFFITPNKDRLKLFTLFFISFIFSFLIASILIIPGYEYITQGSSYHHPGIQQATSVDIRNIIFWPFPRLFAALRESSIKLQSNIKFGIWNLEYVGVLAFFFLVSSVFLIVFQWNKLRKLPFYKYYLFFFLFLLILLLQYFGLFQNPIFTKLPGFSQTNFPKYSLTLINFLIATNAAFVINYLIENKFTFILTFSTLFIVIFAGVTYFTFKTAAININMYGHFVKQLLFSVGLILSTFVLIAFKNTIRVKNVFIYFLILFLVIIEFYIYIPRRGDMQRRDNLLKPPFINFLKSKDYKEFRIFSPDRLLYPDYSSVFDLNDVRNLDALWPRLYYDYLKNFVVSDIDAGAMRFTGIREDGAKRDAKVIGNHFFDLLGVKYFLSKKDIKTYNLSNIYDQINETQLIRREEFDINGLIRPVLFEHPNSSVKLDISIPDGAGYFYLFPAMSPEIFKAPVISDGVKFTVIATNEGKELFEKELIIDPRNPDNLKWFEFKIGPFVGVKSFQLTLNTDQLKNNAADWAGWGGFEWDVEQKNEPARSQFIKVYDNEIKIYENENFVPRIHSVSKVICAKNEEEIVSLMNLNESRIRDMSVNLSDGCVTKDYDVSQFVLRHQVFDDNKVSFEYDAKIDSFVILSNTYFPGWKFRINDKDQKIVRANFAMQGLSLPAGENMKVEVVYDPISFKIGLTVTFVSGLICLAMFFSKRKIC